MYKFSSLTSIIFIYCALTIFTLCFNPTIPSVCFVGFHDILVPMPLINIDGHAKLDTCIVLAIAFDFFQVVSILAVVMGDVRKT